MPAKKVVFVIVEGPTDEDALGVIFQRFFDKNTVRVKQNAEKSLLQTAEKTAPGPLT